MSAATRDKEPWVQGPTGYCFAEAMVNSVSQSKYVVDWLRDREPLCLQPSEG